MEIVLDVPRTGRKVQLKELLISAIESRPVIWDKRSRESRNRCEVEALWEEVAAIVQRPKDECKKQWKYLMDQFRVLHSANTNKKSESGFQDSPVIKWAFYKQLSFMEDVLDRRSVFSSLVEIDSDEKLIQTPDASNGQSVFTDEQENENIITSPEVTSILSLASNTPFDDQATSSCEMPRTKRQKLSSGKLAAETELIIDRLGYIQKELQKEQDGCSHFCNYLKHMMHRLKPEVQRKCEGQILKLVNGHLDDDTPYVLCASDSDQTVQKVVANLKAK